MKIKKSKVESVALLIARQVIKDELKKQGWKISHCLASDITLAAKELLSISPEIYKMAKTRIETEQSRSA